MGCKEVKKDRMRYKEVKKDRMRYKEVKKKETKKSYKGTKNPIEHGEGTFRRNFPFTKLLFSVY